MTETKKRTLQIVFLIVLLLACAGCANRVEINDRVFVLGVAIDKPQSPEQKTENQQNQALMESQQGEASDTQGQDSGGYLRVQPPPKDQTPRYAMTIETPIIKQLGANTGGGAGGSQGAGNKWVITTTGNTVWDMERSLSIRIGRQDFYGHLKAIIISDEVAREGIRPVLDFFTRRREVQQNIKLAISNGEARKVLQVVPKEENFASFYVDSMLHSLYRTGAKINIDMLEIRRSLAESGNAVLPRVRASSPTEITAGGAAVLKNWKFVGWLSEMETSGYNLATGNLTGGALSVVDPKDKTELISLLLRGSQSKTSVDLVGGKPFYTMEIVTEWDIVETGASTSLWDTDYLQKVESLVELELQRRVIHIIDKMQREFKADIFGFGSMLSQKYPDYWVKVKEDWDDTHFPTAKVKVKITEKVRRTESKL